MPFQKGNKLANGGVKKVPSPVTLTKIKEHYLEWCRILPLLDLETRAQVLSKLVPWEHAEFFGKPTERVEVSGPNGTPLVANIFFGTKKDE